MINFYLNQIEKNNISVDEIPSRFKEAVLALLQSAENNELK